MNKRGIAGFKQSATLLVGLALLSPFPAIAGTPTASPAPNSTTGAGDTTAETGDTYPANQVQEYLNSCQSTATSSGLDATTATNYCSCTINAIQQRYTYSQFVNLAQTLEANQSSQTPADPPAGLLEIAQMCVPQR